MEGYKGCLSLSKYDPLGWAVAVPYLVDSRSNQTAHRHAGPRSLLEKPGKPFML